MEGTMGRRTLLLIAALVIAALGTTGVFLYVNGVDQRAQAAYESRRVLVAVLPIDAGTSAGEAMASGSLEQREFWQRSIEGLDVRSDVSDIADMVALAPIAAGEPILGSQFGDPGKASRLPIPPGKLAVSVQVGDPARVSGLVAPGSHVAIFLTINSDTGGQPSTGTLLSDVQVIATGKTTLVPNSGEAGANDPVSQAILTLAVDQQEAQKVVYGSQNGQLYFGLLNDASLVTDTEAATTSGNLYK